MADEEKKPKEEREKSEEKADGGADKKKEDEKPKDDKKPESGGLANKAGEPEFKLKLEPEKVTFKSDKLSAVSAEITIQNTTDKRQSFKVKCTSNKTFRIKPPIGFVDANSSAKVKITFQAMTVPDPSRRFFVFYHLATDEKATVARAAWTSATKPEGVKRLGCNFEKADGSTWQANK